MKGRRRKLVVMLVVMAGLCIAVVVLVTVLRQVGRGGATATVASSNIEKMGKSAAPFQQDETLDNTGVPSTEAALDESGGVDALIAEVAPPLEIGQLRAQHTIRSQVKTLEKESVQETVAKLSEVEMYYLPGVRRREVWGLTLPLHKDIGQWSVETVMSNRRFLKAFEDLSSVSKHEAAHLVSEQIQASLPKYRVLFEDGVMRLKRGRARHPDAKDSSVGPTLQISNNPDGSPTRAGIRLQILALVLIAGNLELEEALPAVMLVVEEALKQRERFYQSDQLEPLLEADRFCMLKKAALYNRQILATALLSIGMSPDEAEKVLRELGLEPKSKKLTHYDAAVSPYHLDAIIGTVPVDYSKGELTVRYLDALSDSDFDMIMERAVSAEQP